MKKQAKTQNVFFMMEWKDYNSTNIGQMESEK